ncbi:MAG: peptidase T [Faecalibacterium sp.]|nr:peptidase T [Ruminococcus sp.]MCM1391829.1 peptidase T [Ruminococcus sp.]MCM1485475.1 peptidase T [Faecalibacterium sp.]
MKIQDRFLKYVSFPTMSDSSSKTIPSTEKQLALAEYLASELKGMGIDNAHVDEKGYVYAFVKGNVPCEQTLGLIAHMDTSPEAADSPIKPKIIKFNGEKILLNEEKNIYLSPDDYPNMMKYVGQELIVTDGTTLLGADNKAGMSEIISAVEYVLEHDLPHGNISLCFTPDEEIGRGSDHFDIEKFNADYAYTVDGSTLGTVEYENFNGARVIVTINGVGIHPGCAKGKMINACSVAAEFDMSIPKDERPETTENYEGFYHLLSMSGNIENASMKYIIREHDCSKFEQKKEFLKNLAEEFNKKYTASTVTVEITDGYRNMGDIISKHMYIIERAKDAIARNGFEPRIDPIRGSTDGVNLSFKGLPCPNLCTGAENYHSRFEYVSIQAMETVTRIITSLITDMVYTDKY